MRIPGRTAIALCLMVGFAFASGASVPLNLRVGAAAQLKLTTGKGAKVRWESSDPPIAQVFQNGFVVGLAPGQTRVSANGTQFLVTVESAPDTLLNPAALKQYTNNHKFKIEGRTCYGSELNGQRASTPDERRFTHSNRVINPKPLRPDKPLEWELRPGTEVYDGAGVLMGTVPATRKIGERRLPVSMFNFGASKVLHGRICVYAFSVALSPSPEVAKLADAAEMTEGKVSTSAWLPLDGVVDKETLLERIGLGQARLPALPLSPTGYRVTGGNPKLYSTPAGELSIVRQGKSGPVPSHYLRRPSGTVNIIYSVPGFGLGGEGEDSFLISDSLEFYPAPGAKIFRQPTYLPSRNIQPRKVSPQTMTFLYGAIKGDGIAAVYGWMAREALAAPTP